MADSVIKVRGAVVTAFEGSTRSIKLLCVPMPNKHETKLSYVPHDSWERVTREFSGPLLFKVSPPPGPGCLHEADIIPTSRIGLQTPLSYKASPMITLPPGRVKAGDLYPCDWKIGGFSLKMCAEILIELPDAEALQAAYGGDTWEFRVSEPIIVTHFPPGSYYDPRKYPDLTHFDKIAAISHNVPGNITTPEQAGTCVVDLSEKSVCPPCVYY